MWIDYEAAVSNHRVVTSNLAENRLERLASETAKDDRNSYGCIDVPVKFYESIIQPAFAQHLSVVCILPAVASIHEVFGLSAKTGRGFIYEVQRLAKGWAKSE